MVQGVNEEEENEVTMAVVTIQTVIVEIILAVQRNIGKNSLQGRGNANVTPLTTKSENHHLTETVLKGTEAVHAPVPVTDIAKGQGQGPESIIDEETIPMAVVVAIGEEEEVQVPLLYLTSIPQTI